MTTLFRLVPFLLVAISLLLAQEQTTRHGVQQSAELTTLPLTLPLLGPNLLRGLARSGKPLITGAGISMQRRLIGTASDLRILGVA